jgi:hypothetical protein
VLAPLVARHVAEVAVDHLAHLDLTDTEGLARRIRRIRALIVLGGLPGSPARLRGRPRRLPDGHRLTPVGGGQGGHPGANLRGGGGPALRRLRPRGLAGGSRNRRTGS